MNGKDMGKQLNVQLTNLCKSRKIIRAAFIDTEGVIVSITQGFKLNSDDAGHIVKAITSQYNGLVRLTVGKDAYVCQRNARNALIGRNEEEVLCIYNAGSIIVVGISNADTPGSSIYEMQRCVRNIETLNLQETK